MKSITRKAVLAGSILATVAIVAGGAIWSGAYNVAADVPHSRPVYALLEMARDRSIRKRAGELQVPAGLGSVDQIRQGAGNYDAMCAACHLAPGVSHTELSLGLYPAPPDLTANALDPAEAFWVIKHGIKASGMPAWGLSMGDEYIWNMAAFLQQLPKLDAKAYRDLVASSAGHSHGGGETELHGKAGSADDHTDHDPGDEKEADAHHDRDEDHHDVSHPHPDTIEMPEHRQPPAEKKLPNDPAATKASKSDDHADHDHQH